MHQLQRGRLPVHALDHELSAGFGFGCSGFQLHCLSLDKAGIVGLCVL
jgi:hypothetical protein